MLIIVLLKIATVIQLQGAVIYKPLTAVSYACFKGNVKTNEAVGTSYLKKNSCLAHVTHLKEKGSAEFRGAIA